MKQPCPTCKGEKRYHPEDIEGTGLTSQPSLPCPICHGTGQVEPGLLQSALKHQRELEVKSEKLNNEYELAPETLELRPDTIKPRQNGVHEPIIPPTPADTDTKGQSFEEVVRGSVQRWANQHHMEGAAGNIRFGVNASDRQLEQTILAAHHEAVQAAVREANLDAYGAGWRAAMKQNNPPQGKEGTDGN